jgi:hypothetical protein
VQASAFCASMTFCFQVRTLQTKANVSETFFNLARLCAKKDARGVVLTYAIPVAFSTAAAG